MVLTKDW